LWLLVAASSITVVQRFSTVWKQAREISPSSGAPA
jgi:hypothetical protein